MIHIQKILVPVDFSEASKKAVNYGISLAMEFKSRLVLAHIAPFDKEKYEQAKLHLLDLIPTELYQRHDFEIIVKAGDVREEILGIVRDKEIDLVIMGSHGRSYFERMLLGSVTERMLRKLSVPILTVSHLDPAKEIHVPGPVPLRRIVYATDLTEGSEAGLRFSIRLAHGLDAQLTVVHVIELIHSAFTGFETGAYAPEVASEIRAEIEERFNKSIALVSDGSVPITTVLADGLPYEAINNVAAEQKADLIVLNLQGRGRLERALLGTTAERVIRTATVPVLSLPLAATYKSHWQVA